jgi:putative oxidoreductase
MTDATPNVSSRRPLIASWIAQVLAALIMGQTLFFKFTGAPETIYIFSKVGLGDLGRFGSACSELAAAILLLIPVPRLNALGAALGMGVMFGAIASHLTKLGIAIPNFDAQGNQLTTTDGGLLFALAVTVFVACAVVLFIRRKALPIIGARL